MNKHINIELSLYSGNWVKNQKYERIKLPFLFDLSFFSNIQFKQKSLK